MYFLPLLLAMTVYLLMPSVVLAVLVGLLVLAYLWFAGAGLNRRTAPLLRGQLANRILAVKLLALNGPVTTEAIEAHNVVTPDSAETQELRGVLRDAAATTGAGWRDFARILRRVFRREPEQLMKRYEDIIIQMCHQPDRVTEDSQGRLVELGQIWKIDPAKAKAYLGKMNVPLAPAMIAWK